MMMRIGVVFISKIGCLSPMGALGNYAKSDKDYISMTGVLVIPNGGRSLSILGSNAALLLA